MRSFAVAFVLLAPSAAAAQTVPAIIPMPASVAVRAGEMPVRDGTPIVAARGDRRSQAAARYLADLVRRTRGITLPIRFKAKEPAIRIVTGKGAEGAEGYSLTVGADGARIEGTTSAGVLYGAVTFWQLLTADGKPAGPAAVPSIVVRDAPRFAWRGLMLDSARHVQSPEFVEQLIDWMALHKLNTLHWHLVDDQGWRVEIKRYPRLTSVGAWRIPAGAAAAKDIDPATGKPRLYGGFFTQAQIRRIVAHAAARNITIVPEIELPGHASAAIAAYPELASSSTPPSAPSSDWGVHADLFNTDDATFTFLENVLTEVMGLFPSTYIHIGGDEAVKDQWKSWPGAQARMRALGLTDEDALQSWYIHRIEQFLNAHGRRLIGWDEILKGGLAPNATVMAWHGVTGAIEAARLGHDSIVTPSRPLYFNYRQSDSPDEPPGRAPMNTLADVYRFEPAPAELTPDQRKHVLGVQANIWTEHVRTEPRVEHMLFPRLSALSEISWSPQAARDWKGFLDRLVPQMARYRQLGIDAAPSAFGVRVDARPIGPAPAREASIALRTQTATGTIHYTLDGSSPTVSSPAYKAPLTAQLPLVVRATAFEDAVPIVPPTTATINAASILTRRSAELELCKEAGAIAMEDDAPLNGPRAVFVVNYTDRCWVYRKAPLDGVGRISVEVGSIPFNLQLRDGGHGGLRRSEDGLPALQVRLDTCTSSVVASLPLDAVIRSDTPVRIEADLPPAKGSHDLCLQFTQTGPDPIWTIDKVRLLPARVYLYAKP